MIDNAVGIIGGLGPMATVYFYELVLSLTEAKRDQDHVNMVILNHASIPDRTAYICGRSADSPLPYMIADAKRLQTAGANFIVIPCNTAHYFFDEIENSVSIPVLNIVTETVGAAKRRYKNIRRVGVLATDGTVQTRTYELACEKAGLECVVPDEDVQAELMDFIYGDIKAGKPVDKNKLEGFFEHLRSKGCGCIILGCTELSVAKRDCRVTDRDVLDSLEVLALRTIEQCGKHIRTEFLQRGDVECAVL